MCYHWGVGTLLAGGSAGSCLRPRPPTAAVLGMLAPWSPLLRRAENGRTSCIPTRRVFTLSLVSARRLAHCGAQDVHQRAHQGLGQGRQGEDVCASLPTRCAGSIAQPLQSTRSSLNPPKHESATTHAHQPQRPDAHTRDAAGHTTHRGDEGLSSRGPWPPTKSTARGLPRPRASRGAFGATGAWAGAPARPSPRARGSRCGASACP